MDSQKARNRKRRIPLVRSLLVVGTVIALWVLHSRRDHPPADVPNPPAPVQDSLASPHSPRGFLSYVVKRGDTFRDILASLGLPLEMAQSYHRSLASVGLSHIFPGDSVVLVTSEGMPQRLSLLSRLQYWYHLTLVGLNGPDPVPERRPVSTYRYRNIIKGVLSTSLSEAMAQWGEGDELASRLAEIFAWDINFFVDPRKGDSFSVVFEKKYADGRPAGYGEVLAAVYVNSGRIFSAIGLPDTAGRISYFDLSGKSLEKQFLKAPLKYRRISSRFTYHRRHPILGIVRPHLGIDYSAPRGTPVYAAADGQIAFAGVEGGFGRLVRITHGAAHETMYGHLHSFAKGIRRGMRVRQGDLIGTVGSTGLSTGPHLDYRMKSNGRFVNPLTLKLPSGENVAERDRARFELTKHHYAVLLDRRFGETPGSFLVDISGPPYTGTDDGIAAEIQISQAKRPTDEAGIFAEP